MLSILQTSLREKKNRSLFKQSEMERVIINSLKFTLTTLVLYQFKHYPRTLT